MSAIWKKAMDECLKKINLKYVKAAFPDLFALLEDREYRKMEKLGQKLGIPIPGMFCRRQIFMEGQEIFDSGMNRSHSVTRNYYNLMFCQGIAKNPSNTANFGTGYLSVKDTGGTIRGDTNDIIGFDSDLDHDTRQAWGILAAAGTITHGIVFGTGSGAEDFEGYALGTIIANGSGAGQLDYSQSELHSISNSVLTLKDTLIRDANNNSGGSITVEEAGIYAIVYIGINPYTIMITRDLTGGDAVADTAQYRYTYEVTLVYPS